MGIKFIEPSDKISYTISQLKDILSGKVQFGGDFLFTEREILKFQGPISYRDGIVDDLKLLSQLIKEYHLFLKNNLQREEKRNSIINWKNVLNHSSISRRSRDKSVVELLDSIADAKIQPEEINLSDLSPGVKIYIRNNFEILLERVTLNYRDVGFYTSDIGYELTSTEELTMYLRYLVVDLMILKLLNEYLLKLYLNPETLPKSLTTDKLKYYKFLVNTVSPSEWNYVKKMAYQKGGRQPTNNNERVKYNIKSTMKKINNEIKHTLLMNLRRLIIELEWRRL